MCGIPSSMRTTSKRRRSTLRRRSFLLRWTRICRIFNPKTAISSTLLRAPARKKHGAHGLFGRQENTNLTAAMHDLTAHDGNVWTIIYSLHREDAERLGYNNAAAWRKLLVSQQNKFAEAFHIPASALHWYAAYHDADTHPHIHMMIWTDQETVLKRDAVVKLRSVMTNSIFQAELENLYIRKDAAYKDVTEAARAVMRELVDRMESVSEPPASIQQKAVGAGAGAAHGRW